ncbi:MAG: hypothetical protein CVT66_02510 [Actinobacteria bacterium HGW-Actinobacteria-6]|nr:MAG: hypothetical protein CVT66_02510 [Actinobacteria bacterium HGW-Actinobacteria-6]
MLRGSPVAELTKMLRRDSLGWAFAAVAAGGAAALVSGGVLGNLPALIFGLAALVGLMVAIAGDIRVGLVAMIIALSLDTAGRLITSPVTVTVYHMTLLATLAIWALRLLSGDKRVRPRLSVVTLGFAALVLAAVFSLPLSMNQGATITAIIRLSFLLLFYLAFETFITDRGVARTVMIALVGSAAFSSTLAFVQYRFPGLVLGVIHTQTSRLGAVLVRPGGFFSDPNYLGTFLSVAILAAMAEAMHAKRFRSMILWFAAAGVCSVGLVVTFSRTAWVGVAAGFIVLVLSSPKRRVPWLLGASAAAVAVVLIVSPASVVSRFESITNVSSDKSIATRYLMLGSTVDMIEDHWALGTGLGAFDVAYEPYRRAGSHTYIFKPHEVPLAMWAEMGIPGLIAEVLLVVGVFIEIRRRRHKGWNRYEAAGVAGLIALLVQSLFQYYLYFEYLWLFFALTVAATRFQASPEEVSS